MRRRTPAIQQAARRLRSEMTEAEHLLWNALRGEGIRGMRFRRQHAIDRFVLDFYCPAHKLAVEVDGGVHDEPEQAERDAARTQALEQLGIRVIRVRNEEVRNIWAVLARIAAAAGVDFDDPRHATI
ncbi:endonuclease domain-containing protein [Longimicrobium sp.]|uniref:endonuclease domain-containing protein n=1 Tax=Longimicrobium sp. TaxID=2029185 RepID=UPI003B3B099E